MASIHPNDIGAIQNRTGALAAGIFALGAGLYTGSALAQPIPEALARRKGEYAVVEFSQLENVSGQLPMADTTYVTPSVATDPTRELVIAALSRTRAAALLPVDSEGDAVIERLFASREISKRTRPLRRK